MIVVSSFNTVGLKDLLQFLIDHFMDGEKVNVVYGNALRLLMDLKNTKENQIVTVLFRLIDLVSSDGATTDLLELQKNLQLLIDAIDVVKHKFAAHLVVLLCPSFEDSHHNFKLLEEGFYAAMQNKSIELVKVTDIKAYYSLSPSEIQADKELDIPYSSRFYTALGCSTVRKLHYLVSVPYKVIVVDCDNTLWNGAVDELGSGNVTIKEHHRLFQEFLIKRITAGMLICLSSKNDQQRVIDVFEKRADMRLKIEHLSKIKINSKLTSENISIIVKELNLGLENFVLISSSAADIEEVQDNLPGVVCIKAPENIEELMSVQDHWVFDSKIATKEDRNRSKLYKEDDLRQEYLSSFENYIKAIESVNLSISIDEIREDQDEIMKRISVLSGRTNQFNLFPITKDVADIKNSLKDDNAVFAVHASDRFGEFGLIGVAFCRVQARVLSVDSYFVSCRAFKKGIEYHLIKRIAQYAVIKSLDVVNLKFKRTEKNAAALSFITILMRKFSGLKDKVYQIETGNETNIMFSSAQLAELDVNNLLDSQIKDPIKIIASSSDVIKHSLRIYFNRNLNKLHSMTQSLNYLSEKFFPI